MKAEEWFKSTLMAKQGYKLSDDEVRWFLWKFIVLNIIEEKLKEYELIKSPFETEKGHFIYLVVYGKSWEKKYSCFKCYR